MVHLHLTDGSNNIHILKRKYLEEGRYFQREYVRTYRREMILLTDGTGN